VFWRSFPIRHGCGCTLIARRQTCAHSPSLAPCLVILDRLIGRSPQRRLAAGSGGGEGGRVLYEGHRGLVRCRPVKVCASFAGWQQGRSRRGTRAKLPRPDPAPGRRGPVDGDSTRRLWRQLRPIRSDLVVLGRRGAGRGLVCGTGREPPAWRDIPAAADPPLVPAEIESSTRFRAGAGGGGRFAGQCAGRAPA